MHYTPAQTRWFLLAIEDQANERLRKQTYAGFMAERVGLPKLTEYLDQVAPIEARPR